MRPNDAARDTQSAAGAARSSKRADARGRAWRPAAFMQSAILIAKRFGQSRINAGRHGHAGNLLPAWHALKVEGSKRMRSMRARRSGRRPRLRMRTKGMGTNEREPEIGRRSRPAEGHVGERERSGRRRDRHRPQREHLRGRSGQAHARRRCRHDARHRVRHFLDDQGDHGHGVPAAVEDGKLDLDAPAKTYAPAIGKLQVLEGFDASGNPKLRPPKRDVTTPDAAAAHRRLRLRLLQREVQPPGAGAWPAERDHVIEGVDQHASAVRPGRRLGVRLQHRLGRPGRGRDHRQAARRGHARSASSSRSA